jgi:hypothetical protein
VPSFANEFWRLLLFSYFTRCRVVLLFVVFIVFCSISWLVFINCVVMYLFVCFTSNTAVNENENVFIPIFVQMKYRRPSTDLCIFLSKFAQSAGPPFASRASLPPFSIKHRTYGFSRVFTVSMTITTWPFVNFRGFYFIVQIFEFAWNCRYLG